MYHAIINVPGYLPESDPVEFETAAEAWEYLAEERERQEDQFMVDEIDPDEDYSETVRELWKQARWFRNPQPGVVYGPTPGPDSEHDLGLAYSVQPVE